MDRTSKTHVCPLLIACFLGFSLGAKGQVELISSDTLRIDSLRVEEIKIGYAVGNQQTRSDMPSETNKPYRGLSIKFLKSG